MAILHPFRALRPVADKVEEVASVPYDVINTAEARALAAGKPFSFLHVIRPEIDLPEGIDEHEEVVYQTGADNLKKLAASPYYMQEDESAVYVYRLIMDGRSQIGIFSCVAVSDYDDDTILKHEKTRQDKEDDRTKHIMTQSAHAEPVMLTYRGTDEINAIVNETMQSDSLYDFVSEDGISHTIWRVEKTAETVSAFEKVEKLYVADGHHRCKSASRTREAIGESAWNAEAAYFPAVLFPMDQMHIMSYNRIVYKLPEGFFASLQDKFDLKVDAPASPENPGSVSFFYDGKWYGLTLPETKRDSVADQLDVARFAEHILEPMLGIMDPRTDTNLFFVGGIRGTDELERLVNDGTAEMAISMYATSIEQLVDVSDAGLLMPPKSTWFEPKLRSGLLIHLF